jgi:small subunit ribosomal protein S16
MVRIRLTRTGKKNNPSYRVVIVPQREKRETKFIEIVGHFSPLTKVIEIKEERVKYWLSVGAQPSEAVQSLLIKKGIIEAPKNKKVYSKNPGKKAQERAPKQD